MAGSFCGGVWCCSVSMAGVRGVRVRARGAKARRAERSESERVRVLGEGSGISASLSVEVGDEDGGLVALLGLFDVVGDEGLEGGVAVLFEAALDEVGAAAAVAGSVGHADDPVDALAVENSFAVAGAVARELDALADERRAAGCRRACRWLVGEGHARRGAKPKGRGQADD